jgi:hypothetical protein
MIVLADIPFLSHSARLMRVSNHRYVRGFQNSLEKMVAFGQPAPGEIPAKRRIFLRWNDSSIPNSDTACKLFCLYLIRT